MHKLEDKKQKNKILCMEITAMVITLALCLNVVLNNIAKHFSDISSTVEDYKKQIYISYLIIVVLITLIFFALANASNCVNTVAASRVTC